jgi:hypothetical protein
MYFNLPRLAVLLSLVALCVVANAQAPEPQVAGRVVRSDVTNDRVSLDRFKKERRTPRLGDT